MVDDGGVGEIEGFNAVGDQWGEVADEEDDNDAEEHGGEADFTALDAREELAFTVGFPDLKDKEKAIFQLNNFLCT